VTLEIRKNSDLEPAPRPPVRQRVQEQWVRGRIVAVAVARRRGWSAWRATKRAVTLTGRVILQLPGVAVLLVVYSPRGAGRLLAQWVSFLRDDASAELRAHHATAKETGDYVRASSVRSANLRARALPNLVAVGLVLAAVLAWTAPQALGVLLGVVAAYVAVRISKQNGWAELAAAAALGFGVYLAVPWAASYVPRPPVWVWWLLGGIGVVVAGWAGRPEAKPLVTLPSYTDATGLPAKPTATMIVDALCRAGVPGMTLQQAERVHEETRIIAPGVATSAHGYIVELELPPGVTVDMVVKQRAPLAAALRRDLSTVWPSGNPERHPGYLRLFLSHKPMHKARQPEWPVAAGLPMSYFDVFPMFTDEQLRWVDLTIAGTHMAMGGASGSGKSVGLRQLGVALAFALDTDIIVFDGKRSGDLEPIRDLCHGFFEGAEPEDVDEQLACLRWLVAERERRARFLASLPRSENRQSKVTRELAAKYPRQLAPIVVLFDEVQEYTEYGIKGNKEEKKIRDEFVALLTKLARLARAAGISLVFVSQKPDASVLPSAIMGNCGIRVAFRVLEQVHNDQILGTSARKNGVDATMFTLQDRGIAWVRGGESADTMVARTWSPMVDLDIADELVAKAYALRKAAGRLPNGDIEDAVIVLDEVADAARALAERGRDRAHLAELVVWLVQMRPDYGGLDVSELGARLRNRGVPTPQVKVDGENRNGVRARDLRKQEPDEVDDEVYPDDE
jgi:S-DNA-T family DNA segregation ATPase FtsK/SpoIIIE